MPTPKMIYVNIRMYCELRDNILDQSAENAHNMMHVLILFLNLIKGQPAPLEKRWATGQLLLCMGTTNVLRPV